MGMRVRGGVAANMVNDQSKYENISDTYVIFVIADQGGPSIGRDTASSARPPAHDAIFDTRAGGGGGHCLRAPGLQRPLGCSRKPKTSPVYDAFGIDDVRRGQGGRCPDPLVIFAWLEMPWRMRIVVRPWGRRRET